VRNATRAAVIGVAVPLSTLLVGVLASPAFAAEHRYEGDDPGPGLTAAQTLGIFVGIPVLIIAFIYVVVYASTGSRGPRYRPGVAWRGDPRWWGGPSEAGAVDAASPTQGGGGARAHW
jgi:hypothetical protein